MRKLLITLLVLGNLTSFASTKECEMFEMEESESVSMLCAGKIVEDSTGEYAYLEDLTFEYAAKGVPMIIPYLVKSSNHAALKICKAFGYNSVEKKESRVVYYKLTTSLRQYSVDLNGSKDKVLDYILCRK